jgi:hypothetical protein
MLVRRCWICRSSPTFDGRRQILVQDSTGTSPGRRATVTCVSLRAAGLFIDSQSLVGDGAFSDLAMVETRHLFRCSSRRCWSYVGWRPLVTVVAGNPRDHFVFLDLLGFYMQIQDNHFIPACLLVSTYVAYCNLIFD